MGVECHMKINLFTNDGRPVAVYETFNKIVRKEVNQQTHQLKIPPAWTYDESVIQGVIDYVQDVDTLRQIKFVIDAVDTGKRYEISWEGFQRHAYKMKWRQNARFQQYAILLIHWKETDLNRRQLNMFDQELSGL